MESSDSSAQTASKRGGKRPGAGRPRVYDEGLQRITVYLTGKQLGTLVRIGPTISDALRMIIDESGCVL